ncbi:hypothetical protein N800_05715 [Lysobacter daejeonensis GH1-9]|uniref:PspA/IM30 family protein n=1 Tax=Lysobacter daejeonensis GH1-9 TaxID=1385517 RepID=A0A0A0EUY5_9GAMM|nr:PspA/IM30 family protein [Lysobacter daejeonensis]KGM54070.1 hypothetical protein N800_05715 [Lysobacter daejeonensis GH1-9]
MKPGIPFLARVRSQLSELGSTVRDAVREASSQRVLDEQLQRMNEEVRILRRELDTLNAQWITTQERHDAVTAKLVEREAQALAAVKAGRHDLAREVAAAIVGLEFERDAERALLARNASHRTELRARLQLGENLQRRLGHELDLLRTAAAVARAEDAFAERSAGATLGIPTALESLGVLRARGTVQAQPASLPNEGTPPEDPLDEKLRAAGIGEPRSPVDTVLDRIAAQAEPLTKPKRRISRRKDTP